MSNEKLQERFHYCAGAFLSGKIFSEYAFGLSELFDLSEKGEKTKQTKTVEATNHVSKYINFIGQDLIRIGVDLNKSEEQINNLENILYEVVALSETDQRRVMGLINRIKKEKNNYICNAY